MDLESFLPPLGHSAHSCRVGFPPLHGCQERTLYVHVYVFVPSLPSLLCAVRASWTPLFTRTPKRFNLICSFPLLSAPHHRILRHYPSQPRTTHTHTFFHSTSGTNSPPLFFPFFPFFPVSSAPYSTLSHHHVPAPNLPPGRKIHHPWTQPCGRASGPQLHLLSHCNGSPCPCQGRSPDW